MKILILFLCCVVGALSTKPPKWEKTYTVSGTLFIPYAEISEPFYAWFDSLHGRSRIDYYGGMVKTYQLAGSGEFGTSLKLAPITTNDQLNKITCLQVNGTDENRVEVQGILPFVQDFDLLRTEQYRGFKCDLFQLEEVVGQKKNVYTLWVRYEKSKKYPAARVPIPVKYEMKGYNTLLGSHYDHYYLEYDHYDHNDIPGEIFEIDMKEPCVGFPGPGNGHYATFNPMKEFVRPSSDEHVDMEFTRFKNKHRKSYNTEHEHERRRNVFLQNLRFIHSKNRAQLSYSLGVNHLADRTEDEIKALRGFKSSNTYNGGNAFTYTKEEFDSLPAQYDWRIYGAVTPVKDQSVCGSCWSFGTVGHLEGAYFLKNGGNLVRLSQQALIDCSWGYGNNGCDGGEDFRAYQWIMKMGGIPTEEEYGNYLGQDGYCHADNVTLVAPIKSFTNVTSNDAKAFKVALFKNGPLSVAIDAAHKTFSFYSHGIYYEPECKNNLDGLDHAVLAVGYGTIDGNDYWLIKNSWSNYWGNDGYALMSVKDNNCGVMTDATFVVM
uniref:Putative cathepsin l cathepsin l n=1 Tax=Corethrella appendiculata TaxID=1370023 RepID=U5EWS0_9DIPT